MEFPTALPQVNGMEHNTMLQVRNRMERHTALQRLSRIEHPTVLDRIVCHTVRPQVNGMEHRTVLLREQFRSTACHIAQHHRNRMVRRIVLQQSNQMFHTVLHITKEGMSKEAAPRATVRLLTRMGMMAMTVTMRLRSRTGMMAMTAALIASSMMVMISMITST